MTGREAEVARLVEALHALSDSWPSPEAPRDLRVSSSIAYYDALVVAATGKPLRKRPPVMVLRTRPIWGHFDVLLDLCDEMGSDPRDFLRAQFDEFVGAPGVERPYPPMLTSSTALYRWAKWQQRHVRRYRGRLADAAASDALRVDELATLHAMLAAGEARWKALTERQPTMNPVAVARVASGIVPGPFLLAFSRVRAALDSGELEHAALALELTRLGARPRLYGELLRWAAAHGYDGE